ncbi:MAG: CPBP family intramembrane metalloprotease [Atopobiaceae bacterium]|nr:CPBP family intramembrane metalloprotease [Atopobiaceae bacterium]
MSEESNQKRPMKLFDRPILSYALTLLFALFTFSLFSAPATVLGLEGSAADLCTIVSIVPAALVVTFVVCKVFYRCAFSGPFATDGIADGLKMFVPVAILDVVFFILDRIIGSGSTLNNILHGIALSLMAGVMEEMVFRAFALPNFMRLKRDYGGMVFSVVVTAAVFGLTHVANLAAGGDVARTLQQTITASISGGLFAAVYLNTGTIIPCMLFHFFHDVINLLFMSISSSGAMLEGISLANLIPQIIYSGTELGLAIWYLRPANFDKIRAIWDRKWNL